MPFKVLTRKNVYSAFEVEKGQAYYRQTLEENLQTVEWETITETLTTFLPRNGKILDSGCGLGRWVVYFRKLGFDIQGLDFSHNALSITHTHYPSLPLTVADVRCTPFEDNTFDAVLSFGSFEHIEEGLQSALKETYRILKPGGTLMIWVPVINLFRTLLGHWNLRAFVRLYRLKNYELIFAEYRYSRRELIKALSEARFKLVYIDCADFTPPRSLALFCDWGFLLQAKDPVTKQPLWALNDRGLKVLRFLSKLPKWTYYSNIFCVARI